MLKRAAFLILIPIISLHADDISDTFDLASKGRWFDALQCYERLPDYIKKVQYRGRLSKERKRKRERFQSLSKKKSTNITFIRQLYEVDKYLSTRHSQYKISLDNGIARSLFAMVHSDRFGRTSSILKERKKYYKYIRQKCVEISLPPELDLICAIESGYRTAITSSSGAEGMWQLMEGTARDMGLKVTDKDDERKDWKKSTAAALKYLDWLHKEYKSWHKALSAYHWGPGNLNEALKQKDNWMDALPDITKAYLNDFAAYVILSEKGYTIFNIP